MADQNGEAKSAQSGLVELYGVTWPWMVTKDTLDAVRDYDVWDDDVWLVTYPKAGTHWTQEIVNLLLVDGHEDRIDRAQKFYPIEYSVQTTRHLMKLEQHPPLYKLIKEWKAPRVVRTHLTEEFLPRQIYQGKGKVVYVIRNPKDNTVSYWNFLKPWHLDPKYEEWDSFVRQSVSDDMMYSSWFNSVLSYWKKHRYDKNFLFLKYEDMKTDLKGAVIQISDFLGKNLSDEAIERVVEFSSLKSMKTRFYTTEDAKEAAGTALQSPPADKGDEPSGDEAKTAAVAVQSKIGAPLTIIRKGIVGDWKTKFTVAQNEEFDALYREKMKGSGLKIQFE